MLGYILITLLKGMVYKGNNRVPRTEPCEAPTAAHAIQRELTHLLLLLLYSFYTKV